MRKPITHLKPENHQNPIITKMKKETLLKIGFSNFVNVEKYQKKSPDVDAKNKKMQKCEESEQNSEKN